MKTDQHSSFLLHQPRRQAGAEAVPPLRSLNRRVQLLGNQPAKMPQVRFEHALLGGHLCGGVKMLHAAPAAHPEMRTFGHDATGRCRKNPLHPRDLVGGLLPVAGEFNALAGQGPFHEYRFAFKTGDSTRLVIQRFNDSNRHAATPSQNAGF